METAGVLYTGDIRLKSESVDRIFDQRCSRLLQVS